MGRVNQGVTSFSGLSPDGGPVPPHHVPCPSQTFLGIWASRDDRNGNEQASFHMWPQLGVV